MASDNEQAKERSFQVVDKRRFDSSGHERAADSEPTTHTVHSGDVLSGQPAQSETAQHRESTAQFTMKESSTTEEPEAVAFSSFIMSLATQALVHMGEMPPPSGMEIPRDLDAARQTIDIMTMLQRRTRGNLSPEEARFLDEVLHSLRVSFINAKKKAG
jgi:hypothetical protein